MTLEAIGIGAAECAMAVVNFAEQDYLSLSVHPEVVAAGLSASDGALASVELERFIGNVVEARHVELFSTGWAAGFGAIKRMVGVDDHVVLDVFARACLQEGAVAATANVHRFRHNDVGDARKVLSAIRARDSRGRILVITESLFAMESDAPDLRRLQALVRDMDATLLVDVAHDLGALGPGGRGNLGVQRMVGKVDLVLGSFSKTFAADGGFVASSQRLGGKSVRSLSAVQAAVVLKALEIATNEEGEHLRRCAADNARMLRKMLARNGFECRGDASPIVSVKLGDESFARMVARQIAALGLLANLVESPAVPQGQARLRLQVTPNHTAADIVEAVERLADGVRLASVEYAAIFG
jgi:7-keto-8-aminopelargonate synthetase-like enzyme